MYLCGLNQYCNYHGLSKVQKRPIHEERCGWREAKIQVQGMRLQLHGGEEVGRQVGGSAEAGAGPLPGRARLQGHREGARHKLRHGLPMDKEVGRAGGAAGGRRARPGRRAGRAALLRTVKKNCRWIWTAVDRLARKHIAFVCGDRSGNTGAKLKREIEHLAVERFFSDRWKAYAEVFPTDRLKQSKAETYTVESYNCRIRHYLARFRRKGLCYSKSESMIVNSMNLLFLKLNNQLSMVI